jgi:hypothetical protein
MLRAVPLADTVFVDREETRQQLLLLQTAVGFVLLIACVNIGMRIEDPSSRMKRPRTRSLM